MTVLIVVAKYARYILHKINVPDIKIPVWPSPMFILHHPPLPPPGTVDFMEASTSFLFTVNTTNQTECVTVNIEKDDEIEGAEMLTVSISADSPLLVGTIENMATITILDIDGEQVSI
jgi:hypothetical protein